MPARGPDARDAVPCSLLGSRTMTAVRRNGWLPTALSKTLGFHITEHLVVVDDDAVVVDVRDFRF